MVDTPVEKSFGDTYRLMGKLHEAVAPLMAQKEKDEIADKAKASLEAEALQKKQEEDGRFFNEINTALGNVRQSVIDSEAKRNRYGQILKDLGNGSYLSIRRHDRSFDTSSIVMVGWSDPESTDWGYFQHNKMNGHFVWINFDSYGGEVSSIQIFDTEAMKRDDPDYTKKINYDDKKYRSNYDMQKIKMAALSDNPEQRESAFRDLQTIKEVISPYLDDLANKPDAFSENKG